MRSRFRGGMWRHSAEMKARHVCAVLGVAVAVATVAFMASLTATNDHQAKAVAQRLLKEVPVAPDAQVARFELDYRPNGRVLQGPPMMAVVAAQSGVKLAPGDCVVTAALFTQRHLPVPDIGTELTLIGRRQTHHLRIAAVREWSRPLRGYPNVIVASETAAAIEESWKPWEPKGVDDLAPGFMSDAGRNFDRAKALLLWAAVLTALCLLVNSLFLSVEARRREIAILRMIGLTRLGVVRAVAEESVRLTLGGLALGLLVGLLTLMAYVAADSTAYPMGAAVAWRTVVACVAIAPFVAMLAALIALKPALSVKPLEALSNRLPRKRPLGMTIAFACGFGAFVAVEVWGASLMSAFVPSPEWPDAIVSILPGGVSSFDIEKIQGRLKGVRRIHELQPLQVNLEPLEELKGRGGPERGSGPRRQYRNALLLASDWLPDFRFAAGVRTDAEKALLSSDACLITSMMARARKLKLGDDLRLDCGRGHRMSLKIVGIVDLNWHLVTSRALVRGLNHMPVNTDGPVFVSFDTLDACDSRLSLMVKMTHLWLDFDEGFLASHGVFEAGRLVEREIAETLGVLTEEGGANAVRLHSRDEVADGTLAHGVELIGSMARVPFIFILVISLGFVAMLVASVDSRRREFAVLRAVGATRAQLAKALAGEAIGVAGVGLVFGLLGGSLVGWLCTSGTRAAMANWGIPPAFAVPWSTLALGAVGALGFALLVIVPTSLVLIGRGKSTLSLV